MSIARDVTEIAAALIGLALAGLLISRSSQTAQVVTAVGDAYGSLLATATAQHAGGGVSH